MNSVDLKEVSPEVQELVTEQPQEAGHWRLCLFTMLAEDDDVIDGIATVDFVSIEDQFAGSSVLDFISDGEPRGSVEIHVDGVIRSGTVAVNLHMHTEEMKAAMFECKGSRQGAEHIYDGDWFAPCTDPDCDCGGLSGRFELARLAT